MVRPPMTRTSVSMILLFPRFGLLDKPVVLSVTRVKWKSRGRSREAAPSSGGGPTFRFSVSALARDGFSGAGREALAVLPIPVDQRTVAALRLGYRFSDNTMLRGERTNRIGGSGVFGEQIGLAAAAPEVGRLHGTASARFLHPVISPKGVEALGMLPDVSERQIAHGVKVKTGDDLGGMARQNLTCGDDDHVCLSPPAHARLWIVGVVVNFCGYDLHRAFIPRPRLFDERLKMLELCASRHERASILERPAVVCRIGQLKPLGPQVGRLGDQRCHMIDVEAVQADVERKRKAHLLDESGDLEFLVV